MSSSINSNTFLSRVFADVISDWFDRAASNLRREYDYKYTIRQQYGMTTDLENDQLENDWKYKYNKLVKQRNWLWYNMKNGNYMLLDNFFETDYCFEFMDIRLRHEYELYYNKHVKDRYKYINKISKYIPFSKSQLPVEGSEFDYIFFEEDCDIDIVKQKCTYRRKHRSYESLVDNNRVYKNTVVDNRDYDKIYKNSVLVRNIIEILQSLRQKCRIPSLFRNKRSNSMIELLDLNRFESNDKPTIVTKPPDLITACPCGYCPSITCLVCYSGEGCCVCCNYCAKFGVRNKHPTCLLCRRVYGVQNRFEGNVEQDMGGDSSVVQQSRAKNVLLTETEVTQYEQVSVKSTMWGPYISNDVISSFDSIVNRWYRVGTYTWTTQNARGSTLLSLNLPRDAVFSGVSTCNQPNTIPFRIHRYWRGNIRVKIHVNCNKFQIGQLQAAWYFQPKADATFTSDRNNIYTRSGTHHTVISAAPNNEVELLIPYHAFKSAFHTKSHAGDNYSLPLDLGTLFITVLSPLKTTGETSPSCSYTVFVKFEDNEFTGMMAGDVDTPQQVSEVKESDTVRYEMDPVGALLPTLTSAVEKLLVPSQHDPNRDNPPDVRPPIFVVPTASHSWANGTNVSEPVHNLRLSGRAQTKHPDVCEEEMSIDFLKRKFILQSVATWSQQDSSGKLLYSVPVNPLIPKDQLPQVQPASTNVLESYQLSTIGFLSSLYQYWRGSIEFRFDFVASQFHSGKLLAAYVPGIAEGATITLEQARASPHVVISLDNAMSYTWKVPYVADKPWWPRRYAGESAANNASSPSKLFLFVLNELVLADTVSDNIDIMIYMRGGEDMEFSVPVQPSIGLGNDRRYISSRNNTEVYPIGSTNTYYYGTWVYSESNTLVARRAVTSDAYGTFSTPILDRPVYYTLSVSALIPRAIVASNSTTLFNVDHCVFLSTTSTYGGYVCYPIHFVVGTAGTAVLQNIARAAFNNGYRPGAWMDRFVTTSSSVSGFISNSVATSRNTYGGGTTFPWTATTVSPTVSEDFECVQYEGNREQTFQLLDNNSLLATTSSGFMTYGESFNDLKDLCRRWQMYGWSTVPKNNIERDPGSCSLLVPILPQGLALDLNASQRVNQIWNRARNGHIPLIASLYRFYRGSIRFRIIVSNADGLIVWLQHRPDRVLTSLNITTCDRVSTAEAVFNHTYGIYMQDMSVNRVVEFEIPYYQAANYGLLQQPVVSPVSEWNNFYSLGELSIGFFGQTPSQDVRLTMYYSIADDMRFNVFQGVPPMVLLDDLPEFQGALDGWFKKKTDTVVESVTSQVKENLVPTVENFMSEATDKMSSIFNDVKATLTELNMQEKCASVLGQLLQAFQNPTPTTIAISIASILITIGVITFSVFHVIKEYATTLWNYILSKVSSIEQREEGGESTPARFEDENVNNAVTGFFTIICGGLCTLFGMKNDITKFGFSSEKLFSNIDRGMKISNVCFVFLRNIMSVIGDCKSVIIKYLYPNFDLAQAILHSRDVIERWSEATLWLVDPVQSRKIKYSIDLQQTFFDCYAMGKILKVKSLELQYPSLIQHINNLYGELKKVATDLEAQGIDPIVRKLPFSIYNYGPPGIGKSYLTTNMCAELCKSESITSSTGLLCVLNGASKFWDHCDGQPCLVIDDLFNIRKGTLLEDQIAAVFNVVTPVPLLPPKAAVEDKGRPYNPEIFVMNSNVAFFKTDLCVQEALYRRRDILIFTELDPDFKKEGCKHCVENIPLSRLSDLGPEAMAMLSDNHHLKFKYTLDVTNEACIRMPEDKFLKYDELMILLKDLFKKNRKDEMVRFSQRIQDNMVITASRVSKVAQTMDLEQQWNDAIARRRMCQDFYQNKTWRGIVSDFKGKFVENFDEVKHGVLSKLYNRFKPFHNRYAMKNGLCGECVRIKYQCGACKLKMIELMKGQSDVLDIQTASSSSSVEVLSHVEEGLEAYILQQEAARFETDIEDVTPKPNPEYAVKFQVTETTQKWLEELREVLSQRMFDQFNAFLSEFETVISVRLKRYPISARNVTIFKYVCNMTCDLGRKNRDTSVCVHRCDINPPLYSSKSGIYFINPHNPSVPDRIAVGFDCSSNCRMNLPWYVDEVVRHCRREKYPEEEWMGPTPQQLSVPLFDSIFGNLVKWVWNFYYDKMKPGMKAIMTFFTQFDGFMCGIALITSVLSMVGLGVAIAHDVKATNNMYKKETNDSHRHNYQQHKPRSVEQQASTSNMYPSIKYESKQYDGSKPKVRKVPRPRVPSKPKYESAQQFQVVEDRLKSNLIKIISIADDGDNIRKYEAVCLMVKGHDMLFEKHYLAVWKKHPINTKYYLSCPLTITDTSPYGIEFKLHDCPIVYYGDDNKEYDDTNFCLMTLPLTCPMFKDITKFIAKNKEHEYIDMGNCWLYDNRLCRSRHCNMSINNNVTISDQTDWLRIEDCYQYQYTEVGMCGSILLCASLERPIIGMHFGGTGCVGFSEPLSQEMFKVCTDEKEYKFDTFEMETSEVDVAKVDFRTLLYPQGQVTKDFTNSQGGVSQYIPSGIFNTFENDCEPNPLHPSDRRLPRGSHPLRDGCEFMGIPPLDFPDELVNSAVEHLQDTVLARVAPIRPKVGLVSLQDAICGNKLINGFEPLSWSTSEGFPLSSMRPKGVSGKKWLFDLEESEEGYVLKGMHGELRRQLAISSDLRKKRIECPTVFVDCLKDTVVPKEKCSIPGKTRIFSISPVQYTIAFKQYFNDFIASYTTSRLACEHGIGINCDSIEWTLLAAKLQEKGPKVIVGDYKNFGPALMKKCVKGAFDIIMAWYDMYDPDVERQTVRRVLLAEILHARHLCANVMYTVPCGIPSGSPITAPLNSLVNCLYLRCAWKAITKLPLSSMNEHVNIVVYGDDVCINVSDEMCDIFNTKSLNIFFFQYNIIFTDIDKSDNIIPYRLLNDVSFLKRGFKRHPSMRLYFLAPIELRSIYKCTNWVTRKGDLTSNTIENCVQACELAFGHGPQFYNSIKATLMKACNERLGMSFIAPSWSEKSERCFNLG